MPYVPAVRTMTPFSRQRRAIAFIASAASGSFVPRSLTSSIAHIAPRPRTSPTIGYRSANERKRAVMVSPSARERSRSPSRSILSSTARPAAAATGFVPYVPPSPPGCTASISSARPVTAEIGRPAPSDLAVKTRSGTTPSSSIAYQRPARPMPLWISSAMNTMPCSAQNSDRPFRKPGAGTMKPPSPWIGSTSTAAMFCSPMCLCISSIA